MTTEARVCRPAAGEYPGHFSLLERMMVEPGDREDWLSLHDLHYKTESDSFGQKYYRCTMDGKLIGVVVTAYPKLLLEPRHRMFPKIKPTGGTRLTNTARGKFVNDLFAIINRSVVDTLYRGVGVSYRMINLASRMHPRQVIEIQSAMSKFSPFAMKAGFQFAKPIQNKNYGKGVQVMSRYLDSHPYDTEGLIAEIEAMTPAFKTKTMRELTAFYYSCSSLEKTGRNLGRSLEDLNYGPRELIAKIQGLIFTSPLYGAYKNPDYGRELPERIPLIAFDLQKTTEPLNLERLTQVTGVDYSK